MILKSKYSYGVYIGHNASINTPLSIIGGISAVIIAPQIFSAMAIGTGFGLVSGFVSSNSGVLIFEPNKDSIQILNTKVELLDFYKEKDIEYHDYVKATGGSSLLRRFMKEQKED